MSIMTEALNMDRDDARRALVIAVAFDVVTRYGFKRTTMDDLARAAGMSRPALYLLYKNKTDIFRACLEDFIHVTQQLVSACFNSGMSPIDETIAALIAGIVAPMRKIMDTPHGAELIELKESLAGDLSQQWIRMLETELEQGLSAALARGQLQLPNDSVTTAQIAGFLADAAEGIKHRMAQPDAMEKRLRELVTVIIAPMVR
jgi:AcrR family transcriptional regulator